MTMQKWICIGIGYLFGNFLTRSGGQNITGKSDGNRTDRKITAWQYHGESWICAGTYGSLRRYIKDACSCACMRVPFQKGHWERKPSVCRVRSRDGTQLSAVENRKRRERCYLYLCGSCVLCPGSGHHCLSFGSGCGDPDKISCVGAVVIPAVFAVLTGAAGNREAAVLSLVLTAVMLNRHYSAIRGIKSGDTPKTDVLAAIHKKFI